MSNIKKREASSTPTTAVETPRQAKERLAIVIGINKYKERPLNNAATDAQAFGNLLRRQFNFRLVGNNEPIVDAAATLTSLTNVLRKALQHATATTQLAIYFAGHGVAVENSGFLLPVDAELDDEDTFLSLKWLVNQCNRSNCGELLLILDACYSGRALLPPDLEPWLNPELSKNERTFQILVSGGPQQPVSDGRGSSHSPFTQYLLDALSGKAGIHDDRGAVRFTPLRDYLDMELSRGQLPEGQPNSQQVLGVTVRSSLEGRLKSDFRLVPQAPRIPPDIVQGIHSPIAEERARCLKLLPSACSERPSGLSLTGRLLWHLPLAIHLIRSRISHPSSGAKISTELSSHVDSDWRVRTEALNALSGIGDLYLANSFTSLGSKHPEILELFVRAATNDIDSYVRFSAARGLGRTLEIGEHALFGRHLDGRAETAPRLQRSRYRQTLAMLKGYRARQSLLPRLFSRLLLAKAHGTARWLWTIRHPWGRRSIYASTLFLAVSLLGSRYLISQTHLETLTATARKISEEASLQHRKNPGTELSALLGGQAYRFSQRAKARSRDTVSSVLGELLAAPRLKIELQEDTPESGKYTAQRVLFLPGTHQLLSGNSFGHLWLWDLTKKGDPPREFLPRGDPIVALASSQEARQVAVIRPKKIEVFFSHRPSIAVREVALGRDGSLKAASFDSSGYRLATGSSHGEVSIWDVSGEPRLLSSCLIEDLFPISTTGPIASYSRGYLTDLSYVEAAGSLAVTSSSGKTYYLSPERSCAISRVDHESPMKIQVISSSKTGRLALARGASIEIHTSSDDNATLRYQGSSPISSLEFSPDDRLLAFGTAEEGSPPRGELFLWDLGSREASPQLLESDEINEFDSLSFSGDGEYLAVGGMAMPAAWKLRIATSGSIVADLESQRLDAMAVRSDRSRFAVVDSTGSVEMIDRASHTRLPTQKRKKAIVSLTSTGDSAFLSSHEDGTIHVWAPPHLIFPSQEPGEGYMEVIAAGFDTPLRGAAVASTGLSLAVLDDLSRVHILDQSGTNWERFHRENSTAATLSFDTAGGLLALGDLEGRVYALEPFGTKEWRSLYHGDSPINILIEDTAGDGFLVGTEDGSILSLPGSTPGEVETKFVGPDSTTALAKDTSGAQIAAGFRNGSVFALESGSSLELPPCVEVKSVASTAISGSLIAAGGASGRICIWRRRGHNYSLETSWLAHRGAISGLVLDSSDQIFSSATDGLFKSWPVNQREPTETILNNDPVRWSRGDADRPLIDSFSRVLFLADGRLVSVGRKGTLRVFDLDGTYEDLWRVELQAPPIANTGSNKSGFQANSLDSVTVFAVSPANLLALGTDDLVLIDLDDLDSEPRRFPERGVITALAFDRSGRSLAAGDSLSNIRIWDTNDLEGSVRLKTSGQRIEALAFGSDGSRLAAADGRVVAIWDLRRANRRRVNLLTYRCYPTLLEFLSGDRQLAASCRDGRIFIWNLKFPTSPPEVVSGDGSPIRLLAVDLDDRWLLHASENGILRRRLADDATMMEMICQRTHRNLRKREWKQHVGPKLPYECTCPQIPVTGDGTPCP